MRAGGKVVKNVAGYDLVKLYVGSHGTLGIIVDATLKLRPRPEAEGACWATFPSLDAVTGAAAALAGSELGAVALTVLDARAADAGARAKALPAANGPALLVAFDGLARAVAWQGDEAARRLRAAGARTVDLLDAAGTARALETARERGGSSRAWVAIATGRRVLPAEVGPSSTAGPRTASGGRLRGRRRGARGHGVVTLCPSRPREAPRPATVTDRAPPRWRALPPGAAAATSSWSGRRSACEACPVWDPPGPGLELMRGLKARLDPQGVLNPGRFVGGI